MPTEHRFLLRLTGPGLSPVERELHPHEIGPLLVQLFSRETSVPPAAQSATPAGKTSQVHTHPDTARGYLTQFSPKRAPDRIACFALYLEEVEKKADFTRDDLKRVFVAAAERVPANLGRDAQWAISNNWIAPKPGDPNTYYLTNDGRTAVKTSFPKEITEKTRLAIPRKRNSKGKKDEPAHHGKPEKSEAKSI